MGQALMILHHHTIRPEVVEGPEERLYRDGFLRVVLGVLSLLWLAQAAQAVQHGQQTATLRMAQTADRVHLGSCCMHRAEEGVPRQWGLRLPLILISHVLRPRIQPERRQEARLAQAGAGQQSVTLERAKPEQ